MNQFIGKYVIIEWSKDFMVNTGRDLLNPDAWSDIGFLCFCKHRNVYGLTFHPDSPEYKVFNQYMLLDINEDNIECIKLATIQLSSSDVGRGPIGAMASYGYSFDSLNGSAIGVLQPPKNKSCNSCKHSNLLSLKCKLTANYISDLKQVCSQWTE